MSMRALGICVWFCLSVGRAQAQANASDEFSEGPLPEAPTEPAEATSTEPAAPDEPVEATSGEGTEEAAPLANPRRIASASTSERASESEVEIPNPPLTQGAEVAISMAPSAGFGLAGVAGGLGSLAGLSGFSLGARTDFVFAADPRTFLGFGLRVSHSESGSSSFSVESNQVEIPLVLQLYLDTPRRGVAVPTIRVLPAFRWLTQRIPGTIDQSLLGGRLDVGVGMTYFVTDWLAIRILGDVGVSVDVAYEGANANSVQAYVSGDLGVVVRL